MGCRPLEKIASIWDNNGKSLENNTTMFLSDLYYYGRIRWGESDVRPVVAIWGESEMDGKG